MKISSLVIALAASGSVSLGLASIPDDPFIWLEEAHSARAMSWVETENAKTAAVLERDPNFGALFNDAKVLAEAKDRIPLPRLIGGRIFNFWQDADHPHGIWRDSSAQDFRASNPQWRTVLDLDALSKAEQGNWFWKSADCLQPAEQRCILSLSDGGEDAVTVREFDLAQNKFVAGGFALPGGKQDAAWQDADTLLVSREWTPGELTRSGYPYVVKRLKRGQALDSAVEVFRGNADDVGVSPYTITDGSGHSAVILQRALSIFEYEFYLLGPKGAVRLAMPTKAQIIALLDGRLIATLQEEWRIGATSLPQGSVISIELAAAASDPQHLSAQLIYAPSPREAFVEASATRGHLLVHTLDNVNGHAYSYSTASE